MKLKNLFKGYLNDIIFPQSNCLVCSVPIANFANQPLMRLEDNCLDKQIIKRIYGMSNLCSSCKASFELPTEYHCDICHKPLTTSSQVSGKALVCTDCNGSQINHLTYNRSALLYNDFAKELISLYKYKGKESLLPIFINLLAITYDKYFLNETIDLITYVPIHNNRLEIRGFNQAEKLADGLHKYTNKPLFNTLIKVKDTKKQSKQHKWDRLSEIKGSFALDLTLTISDENTPQIEDKNVLIIDDIYTTGFTLNECASILKQAGVNKVFGLTLTRAFTNNT